MSIIRPLKGLDTNLYENLESTFKQDYHKFEIIFSVADENDEALTVVHALMNQYPKVTASVILGAYRMSLFPWLKKLTLPRRRNRRSKSQSE